MVAKSFKDVGSEVAAPAVVRSFWVIATSAKIQPDMTLQRYAIMYMIVILSNPGPTANSGRTKHPAPTVFPVISNAHEVMGSNVSLHHVCTDSLLMTFD